MTAKEPVKVLDLKPYQPFGLGLSILQLLSGLVVISLTLVAVHEFFF